MSRISAPDNAFAFITTIDGIKHRLLKHHNSKVNTGNEHETVDSELLQCALNMINQIPASKEEKDEVRIHLESHSAVVTTGPQPNDIKDSQIDVGLRTDLEKNERAAREIVSSQNTGPGGNQSITNPRIDNVLVDEPSVTRRAEEQLRQEGGKGSILGGGSTPVAPGKDNSPAGTSPDTTHEEDKDPKTDVETVGAGDSGTSPHPDSVVSGDAETSSPGVDVTHEDSIGNPSKSSKTESKGVPDKKASERHVDKKSTERHVDPQKKK